MLRLHRRARATQGVVGVSTVEGERIASVDRLFEGATKPTHDSGPSETK
jgi:hypothetical protein